MPFLFPAGRWPATVKDAGLLAGLLGVGPGASVLDLGCGPGRYALPLAESGFRVTGIDRTRPYLDAARKLASRKRLKIEFRHADMRRFVRPGAFDAVINTFSTFGYFKDPADDLRVCRNVLRSLRPGGRFLIETMSKEVLARVFEPSGWREANGAFLLEEREVVDGWSGLSQRWVLVRGGKVTEFRVYMRLYSAVELRALLRRAGFRQVEVFGGLERETYDNNARRLVTLGRK